MRHRTSRRPAGVLVVAALVGGLLGAGPLTAGSAASGRGEVTADGVVVTSDIAYGEALDESGSPEVLRLDLYDPAEVAGVRPALVVVHGGGFNGGDKADPVYVAAARAFAAQGLLVASVNHRLRPDTYPDYPVASVDAQHDVQAAVRWLRAHADALRLDPRRIAVTGHSSGAITALRVGSHPDDPGVSGTPDQPSEVVGVLAVSGFLADDVGPATPPLRLLHGTDDPLIPLPWATDTCARWRAAGGWCDLLAYQGASHDPRAFFDPGSPEVTSFLRCTVGGPVAFTDVGPGTSLASTVAWATGLRVLNGAVTAPLDPTASVTRGTFAAWTWRWAGRPDPGVPTSPTGNPALDWVVAGGVLYPRGDGTLATRRELSRAVAALALWRLFGRPGAPASDIVGRDPLAREAPAVDWLAALRADGLFASGRFRPDAPLRRSQLLTVLRQLSAVPDLGVDGVRTVCPAA